MPAGLRAHGELKAIEVNGSSITLFAPELKHLQQRYKTGQIAFPYWAQVWPAARGLSMFLMRNLHLIREKQVLEIAAGLGLPSLVAAPHAKTVLCTDGDAEAVEWIQQSARHHGFSNFRAQRLNWSCVPKHLEAEVLLLSDACYQPEAFEAQQQLLLQFLEKNVTVILSTPHRLVAKSFFTPLLHFICHQQEVVVHQNRAQHPIAVYVFCNSGN